MKKEDAPMYKEVKPKDCTHVGYFVPMGYEVFPQSTGYYIVISGKLCIRCGIEFHSVTTLYPPKTETN